MNQEQQFLLKNLQNMIAYIKQESETKIKKIQSEAVKDAELCNQKFNLSKIPSYQSSKGKNQREDLKGDRRVQGQNEDVNI
jgi:hypothetical protein